MSKRFSASNAGRLMACPASANLPLAIPNWQDPVIDPTSGAKGRGTDLHHILEQANVRPAADVSALAKILTYIADLRKGRRFSVMVEQEMVAEWLAPDAHTGVKPTTTADLVLYTQEEIHVIDPKFGKIEVPVVRNPQLLYYALTYAHLAPKAKGVHLHILQPAIDNMSTWFADTNELAKFMADATKAQAKINHKNVTFGPSDYCTFCPANPHSRSEKGRPLCPAMMSMLYPTVVDETAILEL